MTAGRVAGEAYVDEHSSALPAARGYYNYDSDEADEQVGRTPFVTPTVSAVTVAAYDGPRFPWLVGATIDPSTRRVARILEVSP